MVREKGICLVSPLIRSIFRIWWNGGDRHLSGNYLRTAQLLDVDEAIRKYEKPVLLIHGDADEAVPIEYSIDAAKKYKNAKLVQIPGDTHCYDEHLDQVTAAVKKFLGEMENREG